MLIEVEKLVANSYNPNSMSEIKFTALVDSIKLEDWNRLFPIEVQPEIDWKHIIIDGEHRFKALQEAGIKMAHIEISDLKDWYEQLRTISKNSIHGTHDAVEEANLISAIKAQGITDSEIMGAIWIDENELLAIDNLSNFDISDFDNDEEIEIPEEAPEEDPITEVKLELNEFQNDIISRLSEITQTADIQESILIVAQYLHLLNGSNQVDEEAMQVARETISWVNTSIDF